MSGRVTVSLLWFFCGFDVGQMGAHGTSWLHGLSFALTVAISIFGTWALVENRRDDDEESP